MDKIVIRLYENSTRHAVANAQEVVSALMGSKEDLPFVAALDQSDLDAINRTLGIMAAALAVGPAMQMTELDRREMLAGIDSLMPLAGALAEYLGMQEGLT